MINNFKLIKNKKSNYVLDKTHKYIKDRIKKTKLKLKTKKCFKILNRLDDIKISKEYIDLYKRLLINFILSDELEYNFYNYYDTDIEYSQSLVYEDNFIKLNIKQFDKKTQDLNEMDFYDQKNIAKIIYDVKNRGSIDLQDLENSKKI